MTILQQLKEMDNSNFIKLWNEYVALDGRDDLALPICIKNAVKSLEEVWVNKLVYDLYSYRKALAHKYRIEVPQLTNEGKDVVFRCSLLNRMMTLDACEAYCNYYCQCDTVYEQEQVIKEYNEEEE